jgi:hypothetical protein
LKGQLRDKERQYGLERAAFGLKEYDARSDAAAKRSAARVNKAKERYARMEKDRRYQLDREKFGREQAQDNYQRRNKLGPYKPAGGKGGAGGPGGGTGGRGKVRGKELEGSKKLKFKVDNAVSEIRTLSGTKKKDGGKLSSTEIRAILAEDKVPRVVINAAYDLVVKGYLSRPNIAALKRAGVRIPKSWLRARRNRPPSTTDATGGY